MGNPRISYKRNQGNARRSESENAMGMSRNILMCVDRSPASPREQW